MKSVLYSKKIWKTVGLFLSDKNIVFSQISIEKSNFSINFSINFINFAINFINFSNTEVSDIVKETTALKRMVPLVISQKSS